MITIRAIIVRIRKENHTILLRSDDHYSCDHCSDLKGEPSNCIFGGSCESFLSGFDKFEAREYCVLSLDYPKLLMSFYGKSRFRSRPYSRSIVDLILVATGSISRK